MAKHEITINRETCIGCGLCAKICVAHNIKLEDGKARILSDSCVMCGQCSAVCPREAITISGYDTKPVPRKRQSV